MAYLFRCVKITRAPFWVSSAVHSMRSIETGVISLWLSTYLFYYAYFVMEDGNYFHHEVRLTCQPHIQYATASLPSIRLTPDFSCILGIFPHRDECRQASPRRDFPNRLALTVPTYLHTYICMCVRRYCSAQHAGMSGSWVLCYVCMWVG